MEPAMEKKFCLIKQYDTSHWILQKKKSFYLTELNSTNHWIPKENKSFCPNQQIGINHLVLKKNKIFHHINCGVIQGFPTLRKAVTTHVKKISYFFTCVDIANQLLTRHSPLAPLGQVDE